MSVQLIWKEFLKFAQEEAGSQVVETWFKTVSLDRWDKANEIAHLVMPNQFVSSWIRQHYINLLTTHLGRLLHSTKITFSFSYPNNSSKEKENSKSFQVIPATTSIVVSQASRPETKQYAIERVPSPEKKKKRREIVPYEDYEFSSFVVGPSNHLAYSAAYAISQGAGKTYNPLFIYGGTGLGKTHLMHCVGNETKRHRPTARIVYKTSDNFVDEFIRSIRFDRIHHFREKYRKVDLLMIDDVQFFSQKEQTQEAFFHIFNTLHEQGKQIILSSDTPPAQIRGLQDRLRSRLGWGLVADIQPPTLETKIAILMKKAHRNNIKLDNDVANIIASRVKSNIRELEGALTSLNALAGLRKQNISCELAEQELAIHVHKKKTGVAPHELLDAIAKHYSVSSSSIKSKTRTRNIASIRQILIYLMKKHTSCSLKVIGECVGGRNHATILYSINQAEERIKNDISLSQTIDSIERTIISQL